MDPESFFHLSDPPPMASTLNHVACSLISRRNTFKEKLPLGKNRTYKVTFSSEIRQPRFRAALKLVKFELTKAN